MCSRASQGVILIRLPSGVHVISLARTDKETEDTTEEEVSQAEQSAEEEQGE